MTLDVNELRRMIDHELEHAGHAHDADENAHADEAAAEAEKATDEALTPAASQ